jgi:tetratricopeptide (TPR) repeat protein
MLQRMVALAALLAWIPASAGTRDEARAAYTHGEAAFALGKYSEAATLFEHAFELRPDPAILYNAAQAHRLAGNRQRALLLYRNYLRIYGSRAINREEIESRIVELEREPRPEAPAAPPPPEVKPQSAPSQPSSSPPPPATVLPTPSAAPALIETSSVQSAPTRRDAVYKKAWFWCVIGGAAVVATGVTLGVVYGQPGPPKASLGNFQAN